jgi:mannose-6-phosphate isomerase
MELLRGVVKGYDWGHPRAIAEMLGHEPPGHPEAEYWLGAHPSAPSLTLDQNRALDDLIAEDLEALVGPAVAQRFDGLPFLLKILAAARPLSIQAHPSLDQARVGFTREESEGIALDAPERSYRDANHKPELICALTPFEAKCGFRPIGESRRLVAALDAPALDELAARLRSDGSEADVLADTVAWLLRLPDVEAARMVRAAGTAAANRLPVACRGDRTLAGAAGPGPGTEHNYEQKVEHGFERELAWTVRIAEAFPGDVGVVVALLLNHVSLVPGQAIFLQSGNLHSYLRGVGVELMANSDNVVRGGLTSKHIDVEELLAIVDYRPSRAPVQTASGAVHRFEVPVPEFSLTRLDSTSHQLGQPEFTPAGPEIVLVTSGALTLTSAQRRLEVPAGAAALVGYSDGPYRVADRAPGRTVAWLAGAGLGSGA